MSTSKAKFKDKGIRDILSGVSKLNSTRIRVGVIGPGANDRHPTSGYTAWQIGALQEFGSVSAGIPERSFIRSTLADIPWIRNTLGNAMKNVISGRRSAKEALDLAGNIFANAIKRQVMSGVQPPNAQATIDWKGHDDTLIGRTRTLFNAIAHIVIDGIA